MLIITSIFDIKSREVPEKLWIPFAPLAVFTYLELHYVNLLLFIYSVVVSVALLMVMTYVGLMGGADVVLILLLGLGNPVVMPIFFPRFSLLGGEAITVVLYTSLIITLVGLYNAIKNWKYTKDVTGANRFLLAFSGKRMAVSQFLNSSSTFSDE
jgi:Type IV leader peptidase family.